MPNKRHALGRGLSALIPSIPSQSESLDKPHEVDLDLLEPNQDQPRTDLDEVKLDELAQSIKSSGVIQPVLVRQRSTGKYEIVAGERRWRAAQRAGLMKVPVLVRDVPDEKRLELALIENIQRENLNPIDEGKAYRRLADELHLTQEEVAELVGKDRATVANYQRLLTLPSEVQREVSSGALSMGHARALIGLADETTQLRIARDIRSRNLSVRETEALVRKLLAPIQKHQPVKPSDVHTQAAEERLRLVIGTRVRIVRRAKGGRIEIQFKSEDELQRLFDRLIGSE